MTREEREARKAQILVEMETEGADLKALEDEVRAINAEDAAEVAAEAAKNEIRANIAGGAGTVVKSMEEVKPAAEERAKKFAETRHEVYGVEETRALLVSSGKIATPTGVSGINDAAGARYSSIVDLVNVVNCEGMGSNKVAYIKVDAAAAGEQTEGEAAADKEPTVDYVTITPVSIACKSQISKQARKQSPLAYSAKVQQQAMYSLKKKAAAMITEAIKTSTLTATVNATVASGKGVVDATTLRKLVLGYGGDEAVEGSAVLMLNKTDLVAFGDVRGTNEKKPVYEIIPDGDNPNTGVIKDGGLSVKYVINSALTAANGTAAAGTDTATMLYGNPMCFELDLFSDYEINVSADFAFTSLMDTIVGDAEIGGAVTVQNGFVKLVIPHT